MAVKNELKVTEERKKELFYNVLTKEDVTFLLKLLDEGGTKGAESFQRMKIKNLLNIKSAQRGKKFSPWDYIKKTITVPQLTDEQKEDIVSFIKSKASEIPAFIRYIALMNEDEEFFNENFEKFFQNVENGKDFMSGVWVQYSEEEIMETFLNNFHKDEEALKDAIIETTKLSSTFGEELLELKEKLADVGLSEFNALESELTEEGYAPALILLVYLIVGNYPRELRNPIYYLTMERMTKFLAKEKLEELVKVKTEQENEAGSQKDKGVRKQLKKVTQEKKRLEEELLQLKNDFEEEKEKMVNKVEELQKNLKQLSINDVSQKKQLEQYERQMGGYTFNLADDLGELKVVVGHNSPLLYAPIIFPELKFLTTQELINGIQKKTTNLVILQKNGLNFMDYRKVTQAMKEKGIEWTEIDAKEERGIIMQVSAIIQEKLIG